MARDRAARDSRYLYHDDEIDEQDRQRRLRRRHRSRDEDAVRADDYYAGDRRHDPYAYEDAKRERRERRRTTDDARREAEIDPHELRTPRDSYRSRTDPDRRRDSQRMAYDVRRERSKEKSRSSHKDVRRDGTVKRKKKREPVEDDMMDDYVYGQSRSRPVVEEVTVRRSSVRRRSDEGGSSSRTANTPMSGSRSASLRKDEAPVLSRSMSARDQARGYMRPSTRRSSAVKAPAAPVVPLTRSNTVSGKDSKRNSGIFATLFRPPPKPSHAVHPKETPRAECLVCMTEDIPKHKTAKLGCGHRMCHSCLKRQFTLSVSDPQHMPPTCCGTEHIPLKYVERLFDDKFKRTWNKKYQEYTTNNRIYCPTKGCGEWIKPSKIRMDLTYGRRYARCGRCNTKVCVTCNSKFHTRRECPRDEETNRLVEMAKEQGWQRCYSCKAVVELKEGCNHMTCRCSAQFCMVCAAPWKTCNCPWFSYSNLDEEDRLNNMQVPYTRHDVVEVIEMPDEPSPPSRRLSTRARRRPERDRDLEQADDMLAAALRAQLRMEPNPTASELNRSDPAVGVYGLGNSGGHHMNDSYAVRPLATSAARTAAARASASRSFFGRRAAPAPVPQPQPPPAPREPRLPMSRSHTTRAVAASAMAGLSRDGSKRGANRVGTWLNHVEVDDEAIRTAPRDVEVDDWRIDGSVRGID